MGWYEYEYDSLSGRHVRKLTNASWQDERVRIDAVKFLVEEVLQKGPRDITVSDFRRNRLEGLISNYYRSSPYEALKAAGYKIDQWEMRMTPMGFYEYSQNRARAINWLVKKLGKLPYHLLQEDFYSNRLGGMLAKYYDGSPYVALREAGLVSEDQKSYMCRHGPKVLSH